MPNRILRNSIKTSRTLGKLSAEAWRHWALCLTEADDHGCFESTPEILAAKLYPWRRDITPEAVDNWTAELIHAYLLVTWWVENRQYAMHLKWNKWNSYSVTDGGNRTRHRRRTPEPPPEILAKAYKPSDEKPEPDGATRSQHGPIPTPNPTPTGVCKEVREELEPRDSTTSGTDGFSFFDPKQAHAEKRYQLEVLEKCGGKVTDKTKATTYLIGLHVPSAIIREALADMQDKRLNSLNPECEKRLQNPVAYYLSRVKALCAEHGIHTPINWKE